MENASSSASASKITPVDDSAREPEIDLCGTTLGDFRVLRRLGRGGMGQVYLAEQVSLKRHVALKILRPDLAANVRSLERFKREAEAVARTTHANIVQVYAIGHENGIRFMALEYVEGRNLREFVERKGPPDAHVAISIMRQVAAALQRASELGIIHRDIKPENILLTRKGEVKVTDFGLSRCFADDAPPTNLTQSGVTMGTPLYMSPEQVEGKPVDPRTDIYSFGVTAYYMLAGHPPFRGQTAFEVAVQHVQQEPPPLAQVRPDLPAELLTLVHKLMAKNPQDRFQTGREVVKELARIRDSLAGVTAAFKLGSGSLPELPIDSTTSAAHVRIPRRRPWLPIAAVVAAMLLGLAAGWLYYRPSSAQSGKEDFAPVQPLLTKQERERQLVALVRENTDPKGQLDVMAGLKFSIDLGLIYLKERRLNEAEKFFQSLDRPDQKTRQYRELGQLGKAMVYAFRDQPRESNKLFLAVLEDERTHKFVGLRSWYADPQMREMIAEALNYNFTNDPASPAVLEKLRHPPFPARRADITKKRLD